MKRANTSLQLIPFPWSFTCRRAAFATTARSTYLCSVGLCSGIACSSSFPTLVCNSMRATVIGSPIASRSGSSQDISVSTALRKAAHRIEGVTLSAASSKGCRVARKASACSAVGPSPAYSPSSNSRASLTQRVWPSNRITVRLRSPWASLSYGWKSEEKALHRSGQCRTTADNGHQIAPSKSLPAVL